MVAPAPMPRLEIELADTAPGSGQPAARGSARAEPTGLAELRSAASSGRDLYLFVPGWHRDQDSARALADRFFELLSRQLPEPQASVGVTVHWPLFLFPEDDPASTGPARSHGRDFTAGLAAAFPAAGAELAELGDLLDRRPAQTSDLRRFHHLASGLVRSPSQAVQDSGPAVNLAADPVQLCAVAAAMDKPVRPAAQPHDSNRMLWRGALSVLRTLVYYELGNRAGLLGSRVLGPLLARFPAGADEPRIHLIGHSYGARLAAYALSSLYPNAGQLPLRARSAVRSLVLLQPAMSHFTFSDEQVGNHLRRGALARAAANVDGPLLSTFSEHDRLLAWWLPTRALLDHQGCESLQELSYRWGAMGFDGPQGKTPVSGVVGRVGTRYRFRRRMQYRLDASTVIRTDRAQLSGAHTDVAHPELTWLVAEASRAEP